MKIILITLILSLSFFGCKSKKEVELLYDSKQMPVEVDDDSLPEEIVNELISVKEERVVYVENSEPIEKDENYFVIMGSFKILNNAIKFQENLLDEGFKPEILRNENGLFRVSIQSFKEYAEARKKVLYIRKEYPKYNDVWLLKKQS